MFKKTILALVIALIFVVNAGADIMRDVSEAACRVTAGNAYGSGTAVSEDATYIYVLTNAHVVQRHSRVTVEFWKYGRKVPRPITGTVLWRKNDFNRGVDFAIISIPKSSFTALPRIIGFLPDDHNITQKGTYLITAGCPRAQWLSVKEGSLLGRQNARMLFRPVAEDGQSGSGLFTSVDGNTYIVGVVTARDNPRIYRDSNGFDVPMGIALDIKWVGKALRNQVASVPTTNLQLTSGVHLAVGQLYALGSDGKSYLQNEDGSVNVPPGIQVQQWNMPGPCAPPGQLQQQPQQQPQQQLPPGLVPLPGPVLPPPGQAPSTPPGGGYGTIPPNFGDAGPSAADKKLQLELDTVLKIKLDLEQALIAKETEASQLQIQIDAQTVTINELKIQIEQLTQDGELAVEQNAATIALLEETKLLLDQKEQSITNLSQQFTEIESTVQNLTVQINHKDEQITKYKEAIDNVVIPMVDPPEEAETKKEKKSGFWGGLWKKATGLNPLWWGLLGIGGTLLASKWKVVSGLPGVIAGAFKKKDNGEQPQSVDQQVEDLINHVPERVAPNTSTDVPNFNLDSLRDVLNNHFHKTEAKIDAIGDYTSSRLGDIDKQLRSVKEDQDSNKNVVNNTITIDNDDDSDNSKGTGGGTGTGTGAGADTGTKVDDNIRSHGHPHRDNEGDDGYHSTGPGFDPLNHHAHPDSMERIKQFMMLKQRDGENIEKWALFALLYKEAMELLRQGKFKIGVSGDQITLQGQRLTAEKIDEWVRDQYIKRTTIEKLHLDAIVQDAMLGFLYKEAVELLRRGSFPVLGAQETANTIENWVRQEFLKRLGINL